MLSREDNLLMCQIEPGNPMHDTIKRYWIPALPSHVLGGPDSDPVRITLLGEHYVVFRDSTGQVGLLNEQCCHRGASLCLGRVEDGGIRCIYHGWKFAVDGHIMEMPNAKGDQFKERYRQPAYPVHEAGGVIWTYLGPVGKQPPFPRFPVFELPEAQVIVQEYFIDANFAQVMEGLLDPSHVGVLHTDALNERLSASKGSLDGIYRNMAEDQAPRVELRDAEYGFDYVALRDMVVDGAINTVARTSAFALPFIYFSQNNTTMLAGVPHENGCTRMIEWNWDWETPMDAPMREKVLAFHGITDSILDSFGISRKTHGRVARPDAGNGYLQDRAAMARGETFSGFPNFQPEDVGVTTSMGQIVDRTRESLVPADAAVVRMRRLLLESMRLVQQGEDPIGVQAGEVPRVILGVLRDGESWIDMRTKEQNFKRPFGQFSKELLEKV